MTPDLSTLLAFVAVADCGGFAQAALRLGLSASIVSRRVAALESQLNVQLLKRTTRGMGLTEAGERFHRRSREVLAELALACEEVGGDADSVAGLVRLTAPQSLMGVALIAPVVSTLLARHPGLRFDVTLDERKLDLVSGAIDVAVRVGPVPDSRSFARRLAVLEGRLVASPDYLARHGTPRNTADLSSHRSLEHTELGPQGLWRMEDGEPPRQVVRANSFEVLQQLARAGIGLAVLPAFAVQDDLDRGALRLLVPNWQSPPFELFAVAPPASRLSARAKLVMEALSEQAEVAFGGTGSRR
jgi:DNA-binding transcriptional LysR family regulator